MNKLLFSRESEEWIDAVLIRIYRLRTLMTVRFIEMMLIKVMLTEAMLEEVMLIVAMSCKDDVDRGILVLNEMRNGGGREDLFDVDVAN